jgi:hypothetical protein
MIFAKIRSSIKPKFYARPTAPVREARRTPKTTPFGAGLIESDAIRSVKAWVAGGWHFELTEDSLWFEREQPTALYTLHATHGLETERHPFDTQGQAEAFAWHLAMPPYPQEIAAAISPEEPAPSHYPDEPPVLEDAAYFEPSAEDVAWLNTLEEESGLDAWLDSCAPDNYESMGLEGGGW